MQGPADFSIKSRNGCQFEQTVGQTLDWRVIRDVITVIWRHRNDILICRIQVLKMLPWKEQNKQDKDRWPMVSLSSRQSLTADRQPGHISQTIVSWKLGRIKRKNTRMMKWKHLWYFAIFGSLSFWYLNAYFMVSCLRVSHAKETNIVYISR